MNDDGELVVGGRVQNTKYLDGKPTFKVGVVESLRTEKQEKHEYRNFYGRSNTPEYEDVVVGGHVKWDDGTEEDIDSYELSPEDNAFEREFRTFAPNTQDKIQEKLALASKYLREAVAISEETGVPFQSGISFVSNSFLPASFESKHSDVNKDLMKEICQVYNEYGGWEHSAVC